MARKADERLQQQVQIKLLSHGIRPPCRVTVTVKDGIVTLAGTVQHGFQKRSAVHACRAMTGVKKVVDTLQATGARKVWESRKK